MIIPPTFDGAPIFGVSVSMAVSFKPRERQENGYFGLDGIEVLDGGSRGGTAVASGVLGGYGNYGLALAEAAFLDRNDGRMRKLVDTLGRRYDALLDSFEPKGRVRMSPAGFWFRQYEARFLLLRSSEPDSFQLFPPIGGYFAASFWAPDYFGMGGDTNPPPSP